VPETAGGGLLPVVALEAHLVRAGLLAAAGSTADAVAVLVEALRAAEPEQLRRPFLDAAPSVQRLLRTHPGLAAARGWLFTGGGPGAAWHETRPEPGSTAALSDREREALALLAAGLSTAGIAAAMGLSINTTRGHLRSILRKLSAADRADAVRRVAQQQLPDVAP
jgi:LuxR family maltose regulon positive regulatory protein